MLVENLFLDPKYLAGRLLALGFKKQPNTYRGIDNLASCILAINYRLLLQEGKVSVLHFREFALFLDECEVFLVLDVLWITCVYRVPSYEVFDG
jgi:hypothetical protein